MRGLAANLTRLLVVSAVAFSVAVGSSPRVTARQTASADRPASTRRKAGETQSGKATDDTEPFDATVTRLPRNYRGVDVRRLFKRLHNAVGSRGEFETTAEYAHRIEVAAERLGIGNRALAVASRLPASELHYDADQACYVLQAPYSVVTNSSDRRSSYVGSNAFGVRKRVTRVVGAEVEVVLHGLSDWDVRFPLERASARRVKPSIGLLYVLVLSDPRGHIDNTSVERFSGFTTIDSATSSPTITDPYDIDITSYAVHGRVLEVWLFNRTTGEIVSRQRLGPEPKPAVAQWPPVLAPASLAPRQASMAVAIGTPLDEWLAPSGRAATDLDIGGQPALGTCRGLLAAGQLGPALAESNRVITANPALAEAYVLKGLLLERIGDPAGAFEATAAAAALNPNSLVPVLVCGRLLLARDDCAGAGEQLQVARSLVPDHPDIETLRMAIDARCAGSDETARPRRTQFAAPVFRSEADVVAGKAGPTGNSGVGSIDATDPAHAAAIGSWDSLPPADAGNVAVRPKILYLPRANYTEQARQNRTQGNVILSVELRADGTLGNVTVLQPLPDGLTERAVEALKLLKFEPAQNSRGEPVTVTVPLSISFSVN